MHPLDNLIWNALTTRQSEFAEICNLARRFPADVTSLGAVGEWSDAGRDSLIQLLRRGGTLALFLERTMEFPKEITVVHSATLLQMVHTGSEIANAPPHSAKIVTLTEREVPEMMALAELTKPGPFGLRTRELGTYLGVVESGKLVAMTGERLRVPGFTEVSAVCTHPDHTGNGYAGALVAAVAGQVLQRGELPFLHVINENARAIALYERLGFRTRVTLELAVVRSSAA